MTVKFNLMLILTETKDGKHTSVSFAQTVSKIFLKIITLENKETSVLLDLMSSRTLFLQLSLPSITMILLDPTERLEPDILPSSRLRVPSWPKIVRFKMKMHVFFSRKIARPSILEIMSSCKNSSLIK